MREKRASLVSNAQAGKDAKVKKPLSGADFRRDGLEQGSPAESPVESKA